MTMAVWSEENGWVRLLFGYYHFFCHPREGSHDVLLKHHSRQFRSSDSIVRSHPPDKEPEATRLSRNNDNDIQLSLRNCIFPYPFAATGIVRHAHY